MDTLETALMFTLCVNAMLFLGQMAVLDSNPGGTQFYTCQGSILGQYEVNNCTGGSYQINGENPGSQLPSADGSVSATTGNVFTDSFLSLKNWVINSIPGLNYLVNILNAPVTFLTALGLPSAFSFAISAVWYGITLILIISWFFK
jgi:hypothetical protein